MVMTWLFQLKSHQLHSQVDPAVDYCMPKRKRCVVNGNELSVYPTESAFCTQDMYGETAMFVTQR